MLQLPDGVGWSSMEQGAQHCSSQSSTVEGDLLIAVLFKWDVTYIHAPVDKISTGTPHSPSAIAELFVHYITTLVC